MKNQIKLLLTLIITTISLVGCTGITPTETVESYFQEIKSGENVDVSQYLQTSFEQSTSLEDTTNEVDPNLEEAMKVLVSKLDATVISEEIKDDKAVVTVEVQGVNLSNIFMEMIGDVLNKALNGEETDEAAMGKIILDKVNSSKLETRTGKVNLVKVDKGWKIETDEDIMQLILGNTEQ